MLGMAMLMKFHPRVHFRKPRVAHKVKETKAVELEYYGLSIEYINSITSKTEFRNLHIHYGVSIDFVKEIYDLIYDDDLEKAANILILICFLDVFLGSYNFREISLVTENIETVKIEDMVVGEHMYFLNTNGEIYYSKVSINSGTSIATHTGEENAYIYYSSRDISDGNVIAIRDIRVINTIMSKQDIHHDSLVYYGFTKEDINIIYKGE